jgi:phage shock protein PspC (stress-responsive transcriptional regulator)
MTTFGDTTQTQNQAPAGPSVRPPLRRAYQGRLLAGVCAGLADYLAVDVILIRVAFVVLTFLGGAAVPAYLACLLLIPEEGSDQSIAASLLDSLRLSRPDLTTPIREQPIMSPSSTQQWTRRMRYADQNIRVSDAERNAVAEQLGAHYADGRLDQAEFDERISQTMAAKTRGDLAGIFDDLPDLGPAGAPGTAGADGPGDRAMPFARRRRGGIFRPLVLLAIVIVLASISWHAMDTFSFFAIPWFPIALIVAIVLIATRHRRR